MKQIAFIDIEIKKDSNNIRDLGAVRTDGQGFHKNSIVAFENFIKGAQFVGGHNIIEHDLKYIDSNIKAVGISQDHIIDTLLLSPLLFPTKPYHALTKDEKLQYEEVNNPLNDAIKSKDLFYDEVEAFNELDEAYKKIYYLLLGDQLPFSGFFKWLSYHSPADDPEQLIRQHYNGLFCQNANIKNIIAHQPIPLAYSLSLLRANNRHSITPRWVLHRYPAVAQILSRLRSQPCLTGCPYCNQAHDAHRGLKKFFGFDKFRTYGEEPLQEKAVKAAIQNRSLLAVFPTGGGKSITFQLPALMSGENEKGLTVVISPLQSLMKDQVDNLEKAGITEAVTINGLLDPIERAKSIARVANGSAYLLYISPESLRSKSIERLLQGRNISRFVIDEAHCFSSWGQDFRVDYLYIGDFIKSLQEVKKLADPIPVSCFTATAKQKVIEDISLYFSEKLNLELELFTANISRTNLQFQVFSKTDEREKYLALRNLLQEKNCPTIIYVSRTKKAMTLAEQLSADGFLAKPFHGKMEVREKINNQNEFLNGQIPIIVATSAFGMGVDKKDVGMVIHYEISDSLENYIQEAGRAGRDEHIVADCYILFNEEDLGQHFVLLNQTKLSIKEIQQIWKAVKNFTRYRSAVSNSALEIAREAGWDENVRDIKTRVTTAIATLEASGYLKRGSDESIVFANSILVKTAQEAINKIIASPRFDEDQKVNASRIIRKLFSSKNRKNHQEEEGESRIDYISDQLGIKKDEVICIVNLLRDEKILDDAKDLTAFIRRGRTKNRSLDIVSNFIKMEAFLLPLLEEREKNFHLKELNEKMSKATQLDSNIDQIKILINFWAVKNWIKRQHHPASKYHQTIQSLYQLNLLQNKLKRRHLLAGFIMEMLQKRAQALEKSTSPEQEEILVEFSVLELKNRFEDQMARFGEKVSIDDIEDTLFYLQRIGALKIEGGFLVTYNKLKIERLETDNRKSYVKDDYRQLDQFYDNKIQQIHIVGEYARKMINDYEEALQFVEDYFRLNYTSFLHRYFPGSKAKELKLKMTPKKFEQLFGTLSSTQLEIINDKESKYIVIAAGPGSGKTKVLVHKLASLLLMEDVKHEQLLMLTFSRAAATEFKKRLIQLIGKAASYVEIKTFHSYCFDLLGKMGNIEKSDAVIKTAIEKINRKEVENSHIIKTVLVIDEAQDMNADEYSLIQTLIEKNEDLTIIAVGDDDQNIYEFRGSNSKYLRQLLQQPGAVKYDLLKNYRSKSNIVALANQFAKNLNQRLKTAPNIAHQADNGNVKITTYRSNHLITPLVKDVLNTGLSGSTCILTKTNEEAELITGHLQKHQVQARLIQSNDHFNLYNLIEIRYFLAQLTQGEELIKISDERWSAAKKLLTEKFGNSNKLNIILQLIHEFDGINPYNKYLSDLKSFIQESKLEDFFNQQGETIFVSTIHKAKGKEFDNVFLMLANHKPTSDADKRLIYVAITRAKRHLSIHLNDPFLNAISVDAIEKIHDPADYPPLDELAVHLGYKDIWLDYFNNTQNLISTMVSGDQLNVTNEGCMNQKGNFVLKFSRHFQTQIEQKKKMGYELKAAKVDFVVYWLREGTRKEIKIILPELIFVKNRTS